MSADFAVIAIDSDKKTFDIGKTFETKEEADECLKNMRSKMGVFAEPYVVANLKKGAYRPIPV